MVYFYLNIFLLLQLEEVGLEERLRRGVPGDLVVRERALLLGIQLPPLGALRHLVSVVGDGLSVDVACPRRRAMFWLEVSPGVLGKKKARISVQ